MTKQSNSLYRKSFFEFLKDKSNEIYENSITESGMISASYIEQAIQR